MDKFPYLVGMLRQRGKASQHELARLPDKSPSLSTFLGDLSEEEHMATKERYHATGEYNTNRPAAKALSRFLAQGLGPASTDGYNS